MKGQHTRTLRLGIVGLFAIAMMGVGACGGDDTSDDATTGTTGGASTSDGGTSTDAGTDTGSTDIGSTDSGTTEETTVSNDAEGPLKVMMLTSASYDPCSEVVAAEFTRQTGRETEVVLEGYPTFHDKAMTALVGGGQYDVYMFAYQWTGEFAAQGLLLDMTDRVAADPNIEGIFPAVMDLYTYDGRQYAIPFTAQAETLFYRTDLLEAEGFAVPTTWDEYEAIAEFFTNNPDYPGMYGTSMKAAPQHIQQAFDNRYWGLGGGKLGEPGSTMDYDLTLQSLIQLEKDVNTYSPPGAQVATFSEAQLAVLAGNAVMTELMPSTVLNQLINETEENKVFGKVGAAVMPGGHGEIGSWAMAVAADTDKPDAAYQWSVIASQPDLDLQCYVEFGKSAVRGSTYEDPDLASTWYAGPVRAGLEAGLGIPNGVTASKINNMAMEVISQFVSGEIGSAEEAATKLTEQYADLVNQTE